MTAIRFLKFPAETFLVCRLPAETFQSQYSWGFTGMAIFWEALVGQHYMLCDVSAPCAQCDL